jgi:hypothetical protein
VKLEIYLRGRYDAAQAGALASLRRDETFSIRSSTVSRNSISDVYSAEIAHILDSIDHLDALTREWILKASLKQSRENRYFNRAFAGQQTWKPVLRPGYEQYVVSDWGFVRHVNKAATRCLRPSFEHEYARAPLSAAHRKNGAVQFMLHELVIESFKLLAPLPEKARAHTEIINHLDGDKYNPALSNLEITTQGKNMLHAYSLGLRVPRS